MKTIRSGLIVMLASVGIVSLALVGCKHTSGPPTRSGFLSTYIHLKQLDDTTWRYVNADRLQSYKKFHVMPVAILFDEYDGKPVTAEQRQRAADYVHQALSKELGTHYPVVEQSGADVGEVRVALTSAFKKGLQVGFTLEAELLDSYSAVQVAAGTRSLIGEPYIGDWWDAPSFRQLVDAWASNIHAMLDEVHGRARER